MKKQLSFVLLSGLLGFSSLSSAATQISVDGTITQVSVQKLPSDTWSQARATALGSTDIATIAVNTTNTDLNTTCYSLIKFDIAIPDLSASLSKAMLAAAFSAKENANPVTLTLTALSVEIAPGVLVPECVVDTITLK